MAQFQSEAQRRMAQFLEAAKIDFIYVPSKMGYSTNGLCFSLSKQRVYLYEGREISISNLAPSNVERYSFTADGRFSAVGESKGAFVARCSSCGAMFFSSSEKSACIECGKEAQIWATGSDGIPGWFGGVGESLFDKAEFEKKCASLPKDDGLLEKMLTVARLLSGKPREAILTQEKAKRFGELSRNYPNMAEPLKYFRASLIRTKLRRSKAISFRPMLLVGSPGCGKSSFASELGAIVTGKEPLRVDLGNDVASFTLTGSDMSWRKSKCGLVLQSMFGLDGDGPLKNPVVILDELDKMTLNGAHDVENVFYSILERDTAARFRDNYFDVAVDASGINYIATANDLSKISPFILSRFEVFPIKDYTETEFLNRVIPHFYSKWVEYENIDRNAVPKILSEEIRRLIFTECGGDTRRISATFDRVIEKTSRIDKKTGKFIALFSKKELEKGWQNFAGTSKIPDLPFIVM